MTVKGGQYQTKKHRRSSQGDISLCSSSANVRICSKKKPHLPVRVTRALVHWEAYPLSLQCGPAPVSPVIGSHSLSVRAAELRGPVNWMCLDLWGLEAWVAGFASVGKPLYPASKSHLLVLRRPHHICGGFHFFLFSAFNKLIILSGSCCTFSVLTK